MQVRADLPGGDDVKHWFWHDAPFEELREFCFENAAGRQVSTNVHPAPFKFVAYVMEQIGTDFDHWEWWVNLLDPVTVRPSGYGIAGGGRPHDPNAEWCQKFPHAHPWDGLTLTLHVDPPESGGELVVFEDDRQTVAHVLPAERGLVTLMPDHVWHGVKAIHGDKPRVTLMAGAHRWPNSAQCQCATEQRAAM